jgi:G3E family GTPase
MLFSKSIDLEDKKNMLQMFPRHCWHPRVQGMNGCLCCTVRGDLVKVLKRLRDRLDSIDGVIIETTGLADPAPVAQTFFVDDDIQKSYKLDGIITVVDAKHIVEHLEEEKPEGRLFFLRPVCWIDISEIMPASP